MGSQVRLVNPAYETAKSLKEMLGEKDILASGQQEVEHHFYVSDGADQFLSFANSILPYHIEQPRVIDIEAY